MKFLTSCIFLLFISLAGAEVCRGQFKVDPDGSISLALDPESKWDRLELLRNDTQIQKDLGCDEQVLDAVMKLHSTVKKDVEEFIRDFRPSNGDQMKEFIEARKSNAAESLDELLTPLQQQRLREFAFRMEIVHLGYDWALTHGKLGKAVGVHEEQKTALSRRIQKLEEATQAKIQELQRQLEKDILAELTQEQRSKAVARIGDYAVYAARSREDVALEQAQRISEDKKAAEQN